MKKNANTDDKYWLIRKQDCTIIGPIIQNELVNILKQGNIDENDELCSGNGFWIKLSEKDLIKNYIIENKTQIFNPMSEPENILTVPQFSHLVIKKKTKKKSIYFKATKNLKEKAENLFAYVTDETLKQEYIQKFIESKKRKTKSE